MSASEKSLLRARRRALRDAMAGEDVASASARVCEHLAAWPVFQQARAVMAYMAFGNEISLMPLMNSFGDKRWVIPRIVKNPEPQLILYPYDPGRLVQHPYGMLEPDASLPVIEPREIDLALVPGVWRSTGAATGWDSAAGSMTDSCRASRGSRSASSTQHSS